MPKFAANAAVVKARFQARSNVEKSTRLGPFIEDLFEDTNGIDTALSSPAATWEFDAIEKEIRQKGANPATIISDNVNFKQNITEQVKGVWEAKGAVKVFFSRDDGTTWIELTNGADVALSGPAGKKVRLKAELPVGAVLCAWAAHW